MAEDRERDRFAADELAVVLSHYDLGVIESITEFSRGSRRSPKVGIVSSRGKFLLKRRAPGRDTRLRIDFAHQLQSFLAGRGFPLPKLVSPVTNDEAVVTRGDFVYELFEYVGGQAFRSGLRETGHAGETLALFHELVRQFTPPADCPHGDYHDAVGVRGGLNVIPAALNNAGGMPAPTLAAAVPDDPATRTPPGRERGCTECTQFLFDAYDQASEAVDQLGLASWPEQVIHSDWHPGNMLFRDEQVVAVIDYDSARISRRIIDVANGALQFSMISGGHPDAWPDELDELRFDAFLTGYEQRHSLTEAELAALPNLMIEALIAETVMPIAATGSFGRWQGLGFIQMVGRKVAWLQNHAGRLIQMHRDS